MQLTPAEISDLELQLRIASPAHLAVAASQGKWVPARHLLYLNRKLMDLAARRITRLIVTMPPRHGKSELMSKYFPAWWLGMFPDQRVILASYEADFAASWGRKTRDLLDEVGPELFGVAVSQKSSAADRWDVVRAVLTSEGVRRGESTGGGMTTAGVGGPITGRGAHLLIVDDPIKNMEEAHSDAAKQRLWDWWQGVAYTRLEPGGVAVIIMTRWVVDDLVGRILESSPDEWEVVNLPALAEEGDPLGRLPGEALWPERYSEKALEDIRQNVGPYVWAAEYQQRPYKREGGMFKREWFAIVDSPPPREEFDAIVRYWDCAATEKKKGKGDPDWTVGVKVGRKGNDFYILDVRRTRATPAHVEELMRVTAEADGIDVPIYMEEEPGASGKAWADHVARDVLIGFAFQSVRASGSKEVRAMVVSSAAEAGRVKLVRAYWNEEFLNEFEAFPHGAHDDQVDATSGAFAQISVDDFIFV